MRYKVIISSWEKCHDSHMKDLHYESSVCVWAYLCLSVSEDEEDEEGDGAIRYCPMQTSDNHLLRFISRRHNSWSLTVLLGELFRFQVMSLTWIQWVQQLKTVLTLLTLTSWCHQRCSRWKTTLQCEWPVNANQSIFKFKCSWCTKEGESATSHWDSSVIFCS